MHIISGMITFPNAKINLGLNIVSKRNDGFHNIESVFYPVAWSDILEIVPSKEFSFGCSGLPIPGETKNNLIIKAFELIKNENLLNIDAQVAIHLHKILPMGAGIGGGSSDGAFALKTINEIFSIGISEDHLQKLAGKLGSDCPFFIKNEVAFCTGKGDVFEKIDFSLKGKYLVLVNPQVHVSTAEAYSGIQPKSPEISIPEILKMPIEQWKNYLKNDFEERIIKNYPKIGQTKEQLYKIGAAYASMTGSGSTVYGIFEELPKIDFSEYFVGAIVWEGLAQQ